MGQDSWRPRCVFDETGFAEGWFSGCYAEALQMIDSLEKWTQVDEKNGMKANMPDEERERIQYEREVERQEADRLKWLKVYALMGLERREEALQLLDELRCCNGIYQRKADSLYRLIK